MKLQNTEDKNQLQLGAKRIGADNLQRKTD